MLQQAQAAQQHQQYQLGAVAEGNPEPAAAERPLLSSTGAADAARGAASPVAAPQLTFSLPAGMPGSAAPSARPSHRGSSMLGAGRDGRVSWMHYPSAQQELSGWPGSPGRPLRRTSMAAYGFGYQRDPSAAAELAAAGAAAAAAVQEQLSAVEQQRRAAVAEAEARQAEEALAEMAGARTSLRYTRQQFGSESEGLIGVPEDAEAEAAAAAGAEEDGEKGDMPSRTTTEDSEEVGGWAGVQGDQMLMRGRRTPCYEVFRAACTVSKRVPHPPCGTRCMHRHQQGFYCPPPLQLTLDDLADLDGSGATVPWYRRIGFWLSALSFLVSLAFFVAGIVMVVVSPDTVSAHAYNDCT